MTDRDLVQRIRSGDARAFEQLFRTHYASLAAFAMRYMEDAAGAEEIVQGLFADLWTKRASWDVRSSERAYLFTAVRNRCLNARRRAAVEVDWEAGEPLADIQAMQSAPPALDAELESAETLQRLRAAIDALPERCRLVIQLRWRDELSYAEIADILGISVKGVENQLNRGLKALRQRMGAA